MDGNSLRIQGRITTVLLILLAAVLAYLGHRYRFEVDMTANGRNSLSPASVELVRQLQGPVTVTAFVKGDGPNRRRIEQLIARYQRHTDLVDIEWIDPDAQPQRVRDEGIRVDGTLLVAYQSRREKLEQLDEQSITNALIRLHRGEEPLLLFVQGHGERRPRGEANHDFSGWVAELEEKGFRIRETQLDQEIDLTGQAPVLVLSQPQVDLLPGEVALIRRFVEQGGNLLWFTDPGPSRGLGELSAILGVVKEPGTMVDLAGQLIANNAAFVLATPDNYLPHTVLRGFDLKTIFPFAAGFSYEDDRGWRVAELISVSGGWSETGDLSDKVAFDADSDVPGPLPIALALTRTLSAQPEGTGNSTNDEKEQRIIVVGDGDFISNSYLGNGGNLTLATNMANWLGSDESFIDIPPTTASDVSLNFSAGQILVIGVTFLLGLPLLLAVGGGLVWWRRRRL